MRLALLLFILSSLSTTFAATLTGKITDTKKNSLAHASIIVKGTTLGTTANEKGFYTINLNKGNYTIICQYIGFKTIEKTVVVVSDNIELSFELPEQEYKMQDVVIKSGGEDAAYQIIRNAIKTREEHLYEIKKFETEVYVKGQIQLRDFPDKFMGQKVDFEDGDTSKKKMIF